jgi:protoheme IX farnesyltransferase
MSSLPGRPISLAPTSLGGAVAARLSDYLELGKPRIVVMELIVAGLAACVATPHQMDLPRVLSALVGTALVAASASIANQWLERRVDALMPRTANRPLASGRVSSPEAVLLSLTSLAVGGGWLYVAVNPLTAGLGLASWVLYVVVYTPLKSRTPLNTAVGAVAGALPIMMGWTATGKPLDLQAWSLGGVLFLWQFPHFMAIAWLYRADYARAGHQMLSVVDPRGIRAGVQAVVGAAALIPVSLIPALHPTSGSPWFYALWAVALGGGLLLLAIRFAIFRDTTSARLLLRASLLYLPVWMLALLVVAM